MRDFTLLTLLRPSEQSIGQWLARVLPFVNSGAIKNITVTSSIRSEYLVGLSKLCNLNIINVPTPRIDEENPLAKNAIYRDCWNTALNSINTEYVLALDDDVTPDNFFIDKFSALPCDDSILFGTVNYRNAENLMLSKLVERHQELYRRDIGTDPFEVTYASPSICFAKTEILKSVAIVKGLEDKPYYCSGFEIARNAREKLIKLLAVPSIVCHHGQ